MVSPDNGNVSDATYFSLEASLFVCVSHGSFRTLKDASCFPFWTTLQTVGNPFIRLVVPLFSHEISCSAERCGLPPSRTLLSIDGSSIKFKMPKFASAAPNVASQIRS
jgi:hypothetical protein